MCSRQQAVCSSKQPPRQATETRTLLSDRTLAFAGRVGRGADKEAGSGRSSENSSSAACQSRWAASIALPPGLVASEQRNKALLRYQMLSQCSDADAPRQQSGGGGACRNAARGGAPPPPLLPAPLLPPPLLPPLCTAGWARPPSEATAECVKHSAGARRRVHKAEAEAAIISSSRRRRRASDLRA